MTGRGGRRRIARVRAGAAAAWLALLGGCAGGGPFGGDPAAMRLVTAGPDGAVVEAAGRRVRVPAPEGRCLSEDMIRLRADAAVLMFAECDGGAGPMTGVTIGDAPLFGPDAPAAALVALSAWADTPEGRRELGMGGDARRVSVIETVSHDGALFALIEDRSPEAGALTGSRFWRVFAEVGGRLAMLSVYDMRGDGVGAEALRATAEIQLAALRAANTPAPAVIAEAAETPRRDAAPARTGGPPPRPR